ncbi:MAG: dienelactone hydrolase family protein [Burkholderiales bacterium]|jgi:dienelactone hydrolase|nr:dienelactone hydrolase family protein [Burkholderiales bacterium]
MQKIFVIISLFLLTACAGTERVRTKNIHDGSEVSMAIEIFKSDKLPAPTVLLLHGCGGVDEHDRDWAKQVQSWGFNAIVVDSFTSRFVRSTCEKAMNVQPLQRAIDAHLTARWVKSQPWSTNKVGLIGFSHGGWSALYASTKQDAEREIGSAEISSVITYYPYCGQRFYSFKLHVPLQIHIGELDEWTPAGVCRDLAKYWGIGNDYYEYKGVHHSFDRANLDLKMRGLGELGILSDRVLRSDPAANKTSRDLTRSFLEKTLR